MFSLSISKNKIKADEKAALKFSFHFEHKVHCLSYKFTVYKDGKIVNNFLPHEFLFDVEGKVEKQFGEVNISEAYLVGNTTSGIYTIQVSIKYFICGQSKSKTVIDKCEVEIV